MRKFAVNTITAIALTFTIEAFFAHGKAWATDIYRSVGEGSTASLESGGGVKSLTIDNATSTATFGTAVPNTIGVGDVIKYGGNVAFIHARTSSTVFTVKSASGAAPTDSGGALTTWDVYRAYTSLANAEAGTENATIGVNFDTWTSTGGSPHDIATATETWHFALYADAAFTTASTWNNWTTSSTYYLHLFAPSASTEVGTSQRHAGIFSASRALIQNNTSWSYVFIVTGINYFRLSGLQFEGAAGDEAGSLQFNSLSAASEHRIYDNIFKGAGVTSQDKAIIVNSTWNHASAVMYFYNNVGYSMGNGSFFDIEGSAGQFNVYNNTVYSVGYAVTLCNSASIDAKNNIYQSCANTECIAAICSTYTSGSNNIDNSTIRGAMAGISTAGTVSFVNAAGGDFTINSAGHAGQSPVGYGANLTAGGVISTDLKGNARHATNPWDAGALNQAAAVLALTDVTTNAYGNVALSSSKTLTFTVTNSGGADATTVDEDSGSALVAPYSFTGGSYPGTGGTCTGTISSGGSCTIKVDFSPVTAGASADTITLTYNNGTSTTTATRAISGTGITPASLAIAANTSSSFGNVVQSSATADRTFTVTNSGGYQASSFQEQVAQALAAPFAFVGGTYPGGGSCGATLNASSSCTVIVRFTPTADGSYNDSIVLEYDDGTGSTQTATQAISGVGYTVDALAPAAPTGLSVL